MTKDKEVLGKVVSLRREQVSAGCETERQRHHMLEAVTNELCSAKRPLEEIARQGKKTARYFFCCLLLLKQIIKLSRDS